MRADLGEERSDRAVEARDGALCGLAQQRFDFAEHLLDRRAAAAPKTAPPTAEQRRTLTEQFRVGQNNDFGASRASALSQRDYRSRVASTVPLVGGERNPIGDGGPQDELARKIYTPVRGTFFDR